MPDAKFKVAIWYGVVVMHGPQQTDMHTESGGGVGGLTLAVALSKYPDIEVEVFEAARQFSEIGAGVGIWRRGFRVRILYRSWLFAL